jgi:hypothetical protein
MRAKGERAVTWWIQQPKRAQYLTHFPLSMYPRQNVIIPYFHKYVKEKNYTVNVQWSVQYTLLLLDLILVMSYCA